MSYWAGCCWSPAQDTRSQPRIEPAGAQPWRSRHRRGLRDGPIDTGGCPWALSRASRSSSFTTRICRPPAAFTKTCWGSEIRQVVYDWFVGYWISAKHEMTLCISTLPEERALWGAGGKGVVIDFVVPDVDEVCARLAERGVSFSSSIRPSTNPGACGRPACSTPPGTR